MKYYAGLDVSLKETFLSVLDEKGKIIHEKVVHTEVESIGKALGELKIKYEHVGIESGQLSIYLCKGLKKKGFPAVCMDARHTAAALSARTNKNDRNDARGIARLLQTGWHKEVEVKSDDACEKKMLLRSRTQLVGCRQRVRGTIRGVLKMHGISLGSSKNFYEKLTTALDKLSFYEKAGIEALVRSLREIEASLGNLDKILEGWAEGNEACQLLMSIPGVGKVTAMTYIAAIDRPERFKKSGTMGAYLGMTPKQYASGTVDHHGRISKMGPKACRTVLYEAAQVLLCRTKNVNSRLKRWGLRLMRKKGYKKAVVAVARKLAVIMHRMLVDGTRFQEV